MFFEKKCLVYTAFGNEMYYGAVNKFSEHGVSYDTVLKINANVHGTVSRSDNPGVRHAQAENTQYDFYVKKEDQYRAQQALR